MGPAPAATAVLAHLEGSLPQGTGLIASCFVGVEPSITSKLREDIYAKGMATTASSELAWIWSAHRLGQGSPRWAQSSSSLRSLSLPGYGARGGLARSQGEKTRTCAIQTSNNMLN